MVCITRVAKTVLISISGRVVLGTDDQTTAFLGALVDGLGDVDELLFIFEDPVDLVVVSGAAVDHDVFVAEEKHDGAGIVQFYWVRGLVSSWSAGRRTGKVLGSLYLPYI